MSFFSDASQRGWLYTGAIIFNRVVPSWLFRFRRFVIYRLAVASPNHDRSDVELGWCESEDQLRAVERLTYFQREEASGPVRAVQATIDGQLAGAIWIATDSFDETELGVRITLSEHQVWLFAAMVDKEMRGRRIYSRILRFVTSELVEQGFQEILVAVNPTNKPSNYAHQKHAESCAGQVIAICFLNWAWCFTGAKINSSSRFSSNARLRPIEICVSVVDMGILQD